MNFVPNTNNSYQFDEEGNVYSLKRKRYLKCPNGFYSLIFKHGRRNIRKKALINLYNIMNMDLTPIPNATKYLISKNGFVYSTITNCEVKMFEDKDGYKRTSLVCDDGIRRKFRRCILVAKTFLLNYSENKIVHHIDQNKQNDLYTNLELLTISEHSKIHFNRQRNNLGQFI